MNMIEDFLIKNRSRRVRVLCVGDAMIDEYYQVHIDRISPEFPMPIMFSEDDQHLCQRPGGVANVAYQLQNFNVDKSLLCFWDCFAAGVFDYQLFLNHPLMSACNINWSCPKARVPIKRRFLADGVQVKRWDIEKPFYGIPEEEYTIAQEQILSKIDELRLQDVAVLSDYDKGFFRGDFPRRWVENLTQRGVRTVVDPKKGPASKWRSCTIFKPNYEEAKKLSGESNPQRQCDYFFNVVGCEHVVITNGSRGVFVASKNEPNYRYLSQPHSVNAKSVVGAGDCFCAVLALAYAHGFVIDQAVLIADQAARVYVQGSMNRPVVPAELNPSKIVAPEDLVNRDFTLAFSNGCFDLLHSGHLQTLEFAKTKADRLVVAVNTDESVRRLKGTGRPVKSIDERLRVLAGLSTVDFVTTFDEDTPYEVIQKIKPDVLVKGGDYEINEIVGKELVKEVYRAPLVDGINTTELLKRYHRQNSLPFSQ